MTNLNNNVRNLIVGSVLTVTLILAGLSTHEPANATSDVGCSLITGTITSNDAVVNGTSGDDIIIGGAADQVINGLGGDDIICGGSGNDEIFGGSGNDVILGEDGDDILRGGTGNDELYGGDGADSLYGSAGDDHHDGGAGADSIYGAAGDDTLSEIDVADVEVTGGADCDTIVTEEGGLGSDAGCLDGGGVANFVARFW